MLLLDADGRMLVLRAHDSHRPERSWWFTPGGGIDPGESARQCAARELREETGYVIDPEDLIGPVWDRTAVFDFQSRPYVQHEVFFVARVEDLEPAGATAWTEVELATIDDVAWMTQQQLAQAPIEVFPAQLREPWAPFLDWDGTLIELGEATE